MMVTEFAITITRKFDGSVSINGPIQDKVLIYGMLEAAKDTVQEWHTNNQKVIAAPPNGLVPGV